MSQDNPNAFRLKQAHEPAAETTARKAWPHSALSGRGGDNLVRTQSTHSQINKPWEGSENGKYGRALCVYVQNSTTQTRVQKSRPGVQAHGSACVCLRAVYKHVFTKLEGEVIIHLQGILATAIPRKGSASWSGDESAEGLWGWSHSATGLASPFSGKVSRPRLAWLLCLGHCFGCGCREHIPGTGQLRRQEGFPSSSFSFPCSSPAPPPPFLLFFLLAAEPKHPVH